MNWGCLAVSFLDSHPANVTRSNNEEILCILFVWAAKVFRARCPFYVHCRVLHEFIKRIPCHRPDKLLPDEIKFLRYEQEVSTCSTRSICPVIPWRMVDLGHDAYGLLQRTRPARRCWTSKDRGDILGICSR